jgi:uncharacterized protein (DUF2237 family)
MASSPRPTKFVTFQQGSGENNGASPVILYANPGTVPADKWCCFARSADSTPGPPQPQCTYHPSLHLDRTPGI